LAPVKSRCTILFFNDFPDGYLLSRAQPHTNSAWTFGNLPLSALIPYQRDLVHYYQQYGLPDIVVMMSSGPLTAAAKREAKLEPLPASLRADSYRAVLIRAGYRILRKPGVTCGYPR
jgi:hypothetical protein